MKCYFLLSSVLVLFVLSRLWPPSQNPTSTSYFMGDPSRNLNLPRVVCLGSYSLYQTWRRQPPLKPAKFGLGPSSVLQLVFLLSAGDVERNPGPKKRVYKHPCGVCQSSVHSNQRSILCEVCYKWFHTKCIGVSNDDYSRLQQSDEAWCCKTCLKEALPYHNTSDGSIFDTSA